MSNKTFRILMLIPLLLIAALATVALADDVVTEEDPTENWCYAGGP